MGAKMDGRVSEPWREPGVSQHVDFLKRMQQLATSTVEENSTTVNDTEYKSSDPLEQIHLMLSEERLAEAFFLARRMAAEGVIGAIDLVESIKEDMP
jgi:hypothetical protein